MPSLTTLRAAARLTPRMAAHQAKRIARDRLVPKIPAPYEWMVQRTAASLPLPTVPQRIPAGLAEFVGKYYQHADEAVSDAAKGRFTLLGRAVEFGSIATIDWCYQLPDETDHHLWRMKLCQLEIVHSLLVGSDVAGHETAVALIENFTRARSFAAPESFCTVWSPYGTSHRLLAILSGLSIGVMAGTLDREKRSIVEGFARMDAGFLWKNVEHDLRNNHTERNLAALCMYHLAAGSISPSRARRLDREVRRIIGATVLPDGMQVERSAMYQGLTLMSLKIFADCSFLSAGTRDLAETRGESAAAAWRFLSHRDGDVALFNDSWLDEVPQPSAILGSDAVSLPEALPDGGYFRLTSLPVEAILDAGDIGPRWNPGHGHADFLTLEVDVDGRRFIVDPGTSQYSSGRQRIYERSATSHNGPHYRDIEPVEYSGCFKVGKLNSAEPLPASLLTRLPTGAMGGSISTAAGRCMRIVCGLANGGILVVDYWNSAEIDGATRLLIPKEWTVAIACETALSARIEDITTELVLHTGSLADIADGSWSRKYMLTELATSITLAPNREANGHQLLVFSIGAVDSEDVVRARTAVEAILR